MCYPVFRSPHFCSNDGHPRRHLLLTSRSFRNSGLIGTCLTRIPPSVADLAFHVALAQDTGEVPSAELVPNKRTFARTHTVPAHASADGSLSPQRLMRSSSMAQLRPDNRSNDIDQQNRLSMYLNNNSIPKLPLELFSLEGLTVLNLRGNLLKYIPPQIANLKNLRRLVLSQNKLTFLPAEMLDMKLLTLTLTGNPWMKPPVHEDGAREDTTASSTDMPPPPLPKRRVVSPTTTHCGVPSLNESCLRVLLSPHNPHNLTPATRHETCLEALHTLPLPDNYIPAGILGNL